MPNPIPGDGVLVGTLGQVLPVGVLYFAPYISASPTAAPAAPLGNGEPPTNIWVKQGLLRDDQYTVVEADPTEVEYRRGFRQRYFGSVIRKAGDRSITAQMDEVEPSVLARVTGETVTQIGGSPGTGVELDLGSGEFYDRTMLAVFYDDQSNKEFHMYTPHVRVRYKFGKQAEFMVFDLTIRLIPFLNASNLYKDLKYYMWN